MKWALATAASVGIGGIALYLVKQDDRSWWIGSLMLVPLVVLVFWWIRDEPWGDDGGSAGPGAFGPP